MKNRFKEIGVAAILIFCTAVQATIFTDIVGRKITIPDGKTIEKVLLGEGRFIHAYALLEGDQPFSRLVGWQGDFKKLDPQSYATYQEKFPEIDQITLIGNSTPDSVSSEKVLTLNPDVAIFGVSGHGPSKDSPLVQYLESSGIPVVFIDFRIDPLNNTIPSIRILGKALQREEAAEKYIQFYEEALKKVTDIVENIPANQKKTVYLDLKAGTFEDCCHTAGDGNMGNFIDIAGGINISKPILPTALGKINLEQLIISDPDLFIATGAVIPKSNVSGIPFGMQVTENEARAGLKQSVDRTGIRDLTSVDNGNVYGLWHHYYNSPQNIIAIQVIAKWLYPEHFESLDPQATLQQIYDEFLPINLKGTFWVELQPKK